MRIIIIFLIQTLHNIFTNSLQIYSALDLGEANKMFVICLVASVLFHFLTITVFSTVLPVKVGGDFSSADSPAVTYLELAPETLDKILGEDTSVAVREIDVDLGKIITDHADNEPNVNLPSIQTMILEVAVYKGPASDTRSSSILTPLSGDSELKPKKPFSTKLPFLSDMDKKYSVDDPKLDVTLMPDSKGMLSVGGDAALRKVLSHPDKLVIPDWLEKKGKRFSCKIGFWVTKDGDVKQTRILNTSGDSRIDIIGEELVKKFIFEQSRKIREKGELDLEIRLLPKYDKEDKKR